MIFCRVVIVLWLWYYRLELDGLLIVINILVGEIIKINIIVVNFVVFKILMERERVECIFFMNYFVYWVY